MQTSLLKSTPIYRVWQQQGEKWLGWDAQAPDQVNEIQELVSGQDYVFMARDDYHPDPGLFILKGELTQTWHDPIKIIAPETAHYMTQANIWWGLEQIYDAGLYLILRRGGVQEIQVMLKFPPEWFGHTTQDVFGTIDGDKGIIYLEDQMVFPWSVLPASIIHEAAHILLWNQGIKWEDLNKHEWAAYMFGWVFHILNGDDFTGVDPTVYPAAHQLLKLDWPSFGGRS